MAISSRKVQNGPKRPDLGEEIDVGFEEFGWRDHRILVWQPLVPLPSGPVFFMS